MEAFVAIVSIVATICSLYILHSKMTEEPYIVNTGLYYYNYVIHNDTVIKLAIKSSDLEVKYAILITYSSVYKILPDNKIYIKDKVILSMLKSGHYLNNKELFNILIKEDFDSYIFPDMVTKYQYYD